MVSHFGAAARLLTGLDVRRIAPPQLVPEIVRQRLADNVHTLENLPALTASRIILRPSGPESDALRGHKGRINGHFRRTVTTSSVSAAKRLSWFRCTNTTR